MKALILAAGYGTRLRPYTTTRPKPLFSINGRPLLDITIHHLIKTGCGAIMINTHHLHHKIEAFIARQSYPVRVNTTYEADILGTGGAIKNLADFWSDHPFLVINSDIFFDVDLKAVYEYHQRSPHPVTLVLHDYPAFNSVSVDQDNCVTRFNSNARPPNDISSDSAFRSERLLAFTGIQVLDPLVLNYIPPHTFYSSIDAYRRMLGAGVKINAFIPPKIYWRDIGTPQSYLQTAYEQMAAGTFKRVWPHSFQNPDFFSIEKLTDQKLKGDGSDRQWRRVSWGQNSVIVVNHGIAEPTPSSEANAFIQIGDHLSNQGIPVPRIYARDAFSGLVFLEDLGSIHLQDAVSKARNDQEILVLYQRVIDQMLHMHQSAAKGFDTNWTYQTASYDKSLILEKECRYFLEAFVREYAQLEASFHQFEKEFNHLAEKALLGALFGFMHRDLQSRNIMIHQDEPYFIDFQGGRLGPLQYDLASLLIDPYVNLAEAMQRSLLNYCVKSLSLTKNIDPFAFEQCFSYCALARNLQMLGAFGFLSLRKQKPYFKKYIPIALKSLKNRLDQFKPAEFGQLRLLVDKLMDKSWN